MTKYAYIEYSGIAGHFPTPSFIERIELPADQFRIKRIGIYEEKFFTDEKFATTIKEIATQLLIRSIAFDKYKVEIVVNEFQNVQLLSVATNVKVFLPDGSRHDAMILEYNDSTKIPGTDYMTVSLTYYDVNADNYLGTCINDHITSSQLVEDYEPGELHRIYAKTDFSITIYTAIEFEQFVTEINETGETINGIHRNSRVIYQTGYKLRFYLSESELIQLQKRLAKFTPGNVNHILRLTIAGSGAQINAVERIVPEFEKIDTDLYKVDLKFKNFTETFNNYY